MVIYTESNIMNGIYGETATPAHNYAGTINFSDILEDLLVGKIPFNTKHVYPTVWNSDREVLEREQRMGMHQIPSQPWTT